MTTLQRWKAALVLGMLGCSSSSSSSSDLPARGRWQAAEPDEYVVQTCTLGLQPPGCVRLAVRDGEHVGGQERVYAAGSSWETFPPTDIDNPIDAMFATVEAGGDGDCSVDEVLYAPDYGFVERYLLDCDGDTQGRQVVCFEPDTVDLTACDLPPIAE